MPVPEIAEAIGRHLNLPARSLPAEEFGGMLVPLPHVRGRITLLVQRICALCAAWVVDDG